MNFFFNIITRFLSHTNSTSGLSCLTTIYVKNFTETALDLLILLRIYYISILSSHPKYFSPFFTYKNIRGKYFHKIGVGKTRHETQEPKRKRAAIKI